MIFRVGRNRLTVLAPAKINLHLEVLGKRPDGYHELETLLVSVSLHDSLVFTPRPADVVVETSDPGLGGGMENLVTRAADLIRCEAKRQEGVSIRLTKRIPMQAGLGGGSSDAAACLAGLNRWWNLGWSDQRLAELGAEIGSDVPFFFHTPAAVCRGRGEKVEPATIGRTLDVLLIKPDAGLSTADVFARVAVPEKPVPVDPITRALEHGGPEEVAALLHNRLEEPAASLSPAVAEIRRQSADWDCLGAKMSGSGSAFFAIAASKESARSLARSLRRRKLGRVFVVQTSN